MRERERKRSLFSERCRRAVLVVESAMIVPLFLFAVITMISFMDLGRIQTEKLVELCEIAKAAGVGTSILREEGERDCSIPLVYSWEPPLRLLPLPKVWMRNVITVRVWSGSPGSSQAGETEVEDSAMVYVTEHGSVYHNADCSYLNLSIREADAAELGSLRNGSGGKYSPCEYCCHSHAVSEGLVYITDYGESYHAQLNCSGLTRTVHMMRSEEAQESMRPCSRCGG